MVVLAPVAGFVVVVVVVVAPVVGLVVLVVLVWLVVVGEGGGAALVFAGVPLFW